MARSKEEYNEYQRKYQLERYHKRRQEAFKYLGGKCSQCESTDDLEIDHIVNDENKVRISKLWSISKENFFKELEKCQLLCHDCHKEKSVSERSVPHGGGTTGKKNCYCSLCKPLKNEYMKKFKKDKKEIDRLMDAIFSEEVTIEFDE